MIDDPGMDDALRKVLPDVAAWAWTNESTDTSVLLPVELERSKTMAPRRLQSFCQGRDCARRALGDLGTSPTAIPVGSMREPIWPSGIVGSISHCDGFAIAAVARASELAGVGVDIEVQGNLEAGVRRLIATPDEARNSPLDDADGRMLFSMKESVYKCIWPNLRRFVDFQEVEIEIGGAGAGTFQPHAADAGDRVLRRALRDVLGRYTSVGNYLLTAAVCH